MADYRAMFQKAIMEQQNAQDPAAKELEAQIMKQDQGASITPTLGLVDHLTGSKFASMAPQQVDRKEQLSQLLALRGQQQSQKLSGLGKLAGMQDAAEQRNLQREHQKQMMGLQMLAAKAKLAKANGQGAQRKLGAEDIKAVGNIDMILSNLPKLKGALQQGDALKPSLMGYTIGGDNDATRSRRMIVEAIGRLQSGGAIGVEEAKNFENLIGTMWDSDETRQEKINELANEFSRRRNYYMQGPDANFNPMGGADRAPTSMPRQASSSALGGMNPDEMSEEEIDAALAMYGGM